MDSDFLLAAHPFHSLFRTIPQRQCHPESLEQCLLGRYSDLAHEVGVTRLGSDFTLGSSFILRLFLFMLIQNSSSTSDLDRKTTFAIKRRELCIHAQTNLDDPNRIKSSFSLREWNRCFLFVV